MSTKERATQSPEKSGKPSTVKVKDWTEESGEAYAERLIEIMRKPTVEETNPAKAAR